MPQDFNRLRQSGFSQATCILSATTLDDLSPKEANRQHKKLMRRYALEATSIDILGELMLKLRQQDHLIDTMARQLKRDDLPAHFFNVYRHAINDSRTSILAIAQHRESTGRDHSKPPEDAKARQEEQQRLHDELFANQERAREMGSFVHSACHVLQAGNDLLSEDLAIRDILRMRLLPKSPREDWLLAELFGCLSEEEKKLNPDTLSSDEVDTDLNSWNPTQHAKPGITQYTEYQQLTKKIFLERLRHYNEVWERAESKVEARMKELGLQPRLCKPFIGVPNLIKRAADGDEEAIEELTQMLKNATHLHHQTQDNYNEDQPTPENEIWTTSKTQRFAQVCSHHAPRDDATMSAQTIDIIPSQPPAGVHASACSVNTNQGPHLDPIDIKLSQPMSNENLSPQDAAKILPISPEDTAKTLPLSPPGRGARGEGFLNRIKPISNSDTSSTTTPSVVAGLTTVPPTTTEGLPSCGRSPDRATHQDLYERDLGKPTTILIALFLAFSTLWACLNLIAGPTALAVVMPLESTDVILLDNIKTDQTINRQDAENTKIASYPYSADPWRSLATWRFHSSLDPFSQRFSTPPQPSG